MNTRALLAMAVAIGTALFIWAFRVEAAQERLPRANDVVRPIDLVETVSRAGSLAKI